MGHCTYITMTIYSQTCIKWSPVKQRKGGIEDRRPLKRDSIHMQIYITRQDKCVFLAQVTA